VKVAISPQPCADWDAFVNAHADATLGHASAWGAVFERSYGLRVVYAVARCEEGDIQGVLPLVRIRGLTGKSQLCSLPFLDSGGVLVREDRAERALVEATLEIARRDALRSVELRQNSPCGMDSEPDAETPRVNLSLPLCSDEPSQWRALGAKVRNQTRKAEREQLVAHSGRGLEYVDGFYRVYARNMRDLGSPPHARAFFLAIADAFGERVRFILAEFEGRAVGGLVAIHHGDRVYVPWASTLRSERQRCPNNLIYWEAIRWAISEGAREFDFGRSPPGSGTYRFKRGWGALERPLRWTLLTPEGVPLPARPLGDHAWLAPLARLWARLPVSVSTWAGARLRPRLTQ